MKPRKNDPVDALNWVRMRAKLAYSSSVLMDNPEHCTEFAPLGSRAKIDCFKFTANNMPQRMIRSLKQASELGLFKTDEADHETLRFPGYSRADRGRVQYFRHITRRID